MKRSLPSALVAPIAVLSAAVVLAVFCLPAPAQNAAPSGQPTLRINSRAVLVDVVVTDRNGNPVRGLKQDAFKVAEDGAPQNLSFFEEHRGVTPQQSAHMEFPKLADDVFSNYSPIGTPPAVNILLIDALNTPMADQMYLRKAAEHYLKTVKPGSRLAIFTLSLRLHFIEGFSDDPVMLAKAMGYQKNDRPEPTVLIESSAEAVGQSTAVGLMNQQVGAGAGGTTPAAPAAMIQSLQQFFAETNQSQTADREYRTLAHLQQLAAYLSSFPGRKNLIWLSGAFPLDLFGLTDMRFDDNIRKTVNLLAAARISIYPVDVRGVWTHTLYTAENVQDVTVSTPAQMMGPPVGFPPSVGDPSTIITGSASATTTTGGFAQATTSESMKNNTSNTSMDIIATDTGGKAFYNQNDLTGIIARVIANSSDFYTISYTPSDKEMNGAFRKISVSIPGTNYALSYRRGYFAREDALPGAAQDAQTRAIQRASYSPDADPLQPFMDFGLPRSQQILYKLRILPAQAKTPPPPNIKVNGKGPYDHYAVDFAVDRNDLDLPLDPADGLRKGTLALSLIVYNKYGDIMTRRDYRVPLTIKPDIWSLFAQTGVQLHAEFDAPKDQLWLRTGIYDQETHKVGTMEVPLAAVHPLQAAAQQSQVVAPQH